MLADGELRSMTGETLTSPDDVRRQLEEIRTTGIAREQDEAVLGECAVASPGVRLVGRRGRGDRRRHVRGVGERLRGAGAGDRTCAVPGARRPGLAPSVAPLIGGPAEREHGLGLDGLERCRVPGFNNAYVATAHGMLGVTLAPTTASTPAEYVMTGRKPPELEPFGFHPSRRLTG